MNKLYALHIITSKDIENSRIIACSNDLDKLTAIAASDTFFAGNNPNDKTLRMHSPDDVYPRYLIREIPYVC